jgi:serine/threonine protein kinase/Tol biopolymer transport system component
MSLIAGSRLGAYDVIGALGVGGMGEVYRGRDTRLNRDVAIKVLPELFAADADYLARFTREAQTLAALNHPNIAQIYAVEELSSPAAGQTTQRALVMELVEGEDLSDVIARGPLPLAVALPIARQVIDALAAAHDLGIVHRDLKPGNIKIRDDGAVKVLDFGLAKAVDGTAPGNSAAALSPTLSVRATQLGIILGTAAYMSPEQARGKPVDKRTDVWAFGCLLYEMLTSRKAFDGEDITEIISAVVKTEPDWSKLPGDLPIPVRTVIQHALVKDRKARIPDVSVVRYILDGAVPTAAATAPTTTRGPSGIFWKAAAALLLLTTIATAAGWYRAWPRNSTSARFQIDPPEHTTFRIAGGRLIASIAAISPDGLTVAFTAQNESGRPRLWVRPIASLSAQELPGTEDASYPFWSPDARMIGYVVPGRLMKVAAAGGPPQTICSFRGPTISGRGATWRDDGLIVFNSGPGLLYRVSSDGGTPEPIKSQAPGITTWVFPSFLPDGRHVLAYGMSTDPAVSGVYVLPIDGGESKRIAAADTGAIYVPATGHLLFVRQGTLLAQRFDPAQLATSGDSVPIAERVESSAVPGLVSFSISRTGVLAYGVSDAGQMLQLTWMDREGKPTGLLGSEAQYRGIELSPDGSRVAAHRHEMAGGDIWVTDVSRDAWSRLTLDPAQDNSSPVWSPDGSRVAYGSTRSGKWGVYVRASNNVGNEERLYEVDANDPLPPQPLSWTRDGSLIVVIVDKNAQRHLWRVSLADQKAMQLTRTGSIEMEGQVSPDGKWLAYMSTENSTTAEIYAISLLGDGGKWPISSGGGVLPRWRGDSRELFFINGGDMMAVDIKSNGSTLEPGRPHRLFGSVVSNVAHPMPYFPFAVTRDGQHFLIQTLPSGSPAAPKQAIVVVLNWPVTLRP